MKIQQQLATRLYELLPHKKELEFGCVTVNKIPTTGEILDTRVVIEKRGDDITTFSGGFTFLNKKSAFGIGNTAYFEIIGQPLRLANLLITIKYISDFNALKTHTGNISKGGYKETNLEKLINNYNLSKDNILDQSDEFCEFVLELLK